MPLFQVVIDEQETTDNPETLSTSTEGVRGVATKSCSTAMLYEIDPSFKAIVDNCPSEYKKFLFLDKKVGYTFM